MSLAPGHLLGPQLLAASLLPTWSSRTDPWFLIPSTHVRGVIPLPSLHIAAFSLCPQVVQREEANSVSLTRKGSTPTTWALLCELISSQRLPLLPPSPGDKGSIYEFSETQTCCAQHCLPPLLLWLTGLLFRSPHILSAVMMGLEVHHVLTA